jgi:imidazolonepropionase-like amidohydrolase
MMTCCIKVRAAADDSENRAGKRATTRPCKGKVVVTASNGKTYCKRHAHVAAEYEAALNYGKKVAS